MSKNQILENIEIEKLIYGGSGLATASDGRRIIISGGAIPGSIVDLRVTRSKKQHMEAQIIRTVKRSPLEQDLPLGWQLYGGCKWLPIPYAKQLEIKETQVKEAFHHLKEYTGNTIFHPITPSPEQVGYRNKVEFSWGKYISDREGIHDDFRFGFHAPAQFDRIIDCTYCVLADEEINAIFTKINTLSRASGLPTYDPKIQVGFWRHLVVRKARKTEEIMLVFSVNGEWTPPHLGEAGRGKTKDTSPNPSYEEGSKEFFFTSMIETLTKEFPHIVSIYFLENTGKADIVDGNQILLFGTSTITEELLGKKFEIQPKSFFQTNSLGAEKLYSLVRGFCPTEGNTLLDLYGGTGTIGLILAERFEQVYSVELVRSASEDGKENAKRNNVSNIEFINQKTEDFLPKFLESGKTADTLVVDPPRDGMHKDACADILAFKAESIIYVSCNPATLVRDLQILLSTNQYVLADIAPMDMFPHTHHIETVARLIRKEKTNS